MVNDDTLYSIPCKQVNTIANITVAIHPYNAKTILLIRWLIKNYKI